MSSTSSLYILDLNVLVVIKVDKCFLLSYRMCLSVVSPLLCKSFLASDHHIVSRFLLLLLELLMPYPKNHCIIQGQEAFSLGVF